MFLSDGRTQITLGEVKGGGDGGKREVVVGRGTEEVREFLNFTSVFLSP